MLTLHFLLNIIVVLTTVFLYTTTHPIYAVLLLVLLFCEATAILFLFNIEFLSLILIVVYVGAIAVLFLFVVMMLNIKSIQQRLLKHILFLSCISLIFGILIYCAFENNLVNYYFFNLTNDLILNINSFDSINNLQLIGQFIFTEYPIGLLLIGLLLLIPLITSITLTLECKNLVNSTLTNRQLSRSANTTVFFR